MKKLWVVLLAGAVTFCLMGEAYSQNRQIRERLSNLEAEADELRQRIQNIEEFLELENMATMPSDLEIFMDENDPTEPGDIKVVKGTLEVLDNCDSDAQWSVESGAGVTIELDESQVYEGTGSIKVTVPTGITAIIKCTKASGSWDLTTYKYLKVVLLAQNATPSCNLYFGESVYNEQNLGAFTLSPAWVQKSWDISGIAAASRNAVTLFSVYIPNASGLVRTYHIDYVIADPGPSQVKANDGDRVILLYPKVYTGSYASSGDASKTITIPRKGTPTSVRIMKLGRPSVTWITGMGTHSNKDDGIDLTDGITAVGDCYFTIANHVAVNGDGGTYFYEVKWSD